MGQRVRILNAAKEALAASDQVEENVIESVRLGESDGEDEEGDGKDDSGAFNWDGIESDLFGVANEKKKKGKDDDD